jgi:hydroxyacylglutathione hydrolase
VRAPAPWCGTILDRDRPVVLIAEPGREVEAATRLGRIGFDNVAGYLAGGVQPLGTAPELIERTARVTAPTLAELMASAPGPLLIDVRTEREWRAGRIDRAVNIPLTRLAQDIARLPSSWPGVVYCASGYRSAIAASLIRRAGRRAVTDLAGGIAAWESAGLTTASADRSTATVPGPTGVTRKVARSSKPSSSTPLIYSPTPTTEGDRATCTHN